MINLVFLCDGHGMETAGKRTPHLNEIGRAIRENEFNSKVTSRMSTYLQRLGCHVFHTAPTDKDTPLSTRIKFANDKLAEYQKKYGKGNVRAIYVSVHYDALASSFDASSAQGFSVFVYSGFSKKAAGRLGKLVLSELAKGTHQKNRGLREANYAVLRETHMPAILTENGFMDDRREALLMISPEFQDEVARETTVGIANYFGISAGSLANGPTAASSDVKKHTVKRGETLYRIAKNNKTTVSKLMSDNGIKDASNVPVGKVLVIK